jgi:predicted ATPase/class 3 adenylate cyclase
MTQARVLLLTDVVDSTKLSETLGDQRMADVWTAHDRVARDLLRAWHGREIDKTDGMLMMFERVDDAVGFARAYHHALAGLPVALRARAGVHVGPVVLRENSPADIALGAKPLEVDGIAKPATARVMAVARGGQTLLTADARDALSDDTALEVRSHGHWVMKGLGEPIELFEVGDADTAFEPPVDGDKAYRVVRVDDAWRPVQQIPNNLPQQVTSFIGRERELRELRELVSSARLVTLLGMGGLGKTRLSLRVAGDVMARFPDGVWFLDFAPIRDPVLIAGEAAQVLGIREEPGQPVLQTLCAAVRERRLLLIFDNCEHVIKASADLANALLKAGRQLQILASSREVLRVPGEHGYPVMPLPVPGARAGVQALMQSTAVRLFVERARLHRPSFVLSEAEAPAVAELVARLEGIPLALELAAARMRSLGVADINTRLKDRYKILTGGGRVLLERQQTLRALVDWSYDLLTPQEQTTLNRLSVFAGGFDLAAAEAVCGAEPLLAEDVLDLLSSLVEKSLVMTRDVDDGVRYVMLETIRDYAREKLQASGDAGAAAQRHCHHYFAFAKSIRDGVAGPEQASWIRRGEIEHDNMRVALSLALSGAIDPFIVVKFSIALMTFWMLRGYTSEGRSILRAALAMPAIQESDVAHAHALYVEAALAGSESDHAESRAMLEKCLALERTFADPVEIAGTLSTLSLARLQSGDPRLATESESEALQLFVSAGERLGEAISLQHLGQIAVYVGDEALAQSHLQNCLAIARELENRELEGEAELLLGQCAFLGGRFDDARNRLERSLAICRDAGDRRGEARALWWLGRIDLEVDDLAPARQKLGTVLQVFHDFAMHEEWADCVEDHAMVALRDGLWAPAALIAGAAQQYRQRLGLVLAPHGQRRWAARQEALRVAMPRTVFDQAWQDGQAAARDGVMRSALAISIGEPPN